VIFAGLLELPSGEAAFVGTEHGERRRGQSNPNQQHHDRSDVPSPAASIVNAGIRCFWLVAHQMNSTAPSCHAGTSDRPAVHPASYSSLTKTNRVNRACNNVGFSKGFPTGGESETFMPADFSAVAEAAQSE